MRISELFKDAVLVESARTVWTRRGDRITKQVIRKHELMDVKSRVRFNKPEKVSQDSGAD